MFLVGLEATWQNWGVLGPFFDITYVWRGSKLRREGKFRNMVWQLPCVPIHWSTSVGRVSLVVNVVMPSLGSLLQLFPTQIWVHFLFSCTFGSCICALLFNCTKSIILWFANQYWSCYPCINLECRWCFDVGYCHDLCQSVVFLVCLLCGSLVAD